MDQLHAVRDLEVLVLSMKSDTAIYQIYYSYMCACMGACLPGFVSHCVDVSILLSKSVYTCVHPSVRGFLPLYKYNI